MSPEILVIPVMLALGPDVMKGRHPVVSLKKLRL
jgi:hypothetical protein